MAESVNKLKLSNLRFETCIKCARLQDASARFVAAKTPGLLHCGLYGYFCLAEFDKLSFPSGYNSKMNSIIEHDMNIDGYLKSLARNGKSLAFRRKRFYRLDGGILSKYHAKVSHQRMLLTNTTLEHGSDKTVARFSSFFSA